MIHDLTGSSVPSSGEGAVLNLIFVVVVIDAIGYANEYDSVECVWNVKP